MDWVEILQQTILEDVTYAFYNFSISSKSLIHEHHIFLSSVVRAENELLSRVARSGNELFVQCCQSRQWAFLLAGPAAKAELFLAGAELFWLEPQLEPTILALYTVDSNKTYKVNDEYNF